MKRALAAGLVGRGPRWFVSILMVLLAIFMLSSCAIGLAPVPTSGDLVGSWTHHSNQHSSTLTLLANHTFSFRGVPKGLLSQQLTANGGLVGPAVSASGTWSVGDDRGVKRDPSGTPFISLVLLNVPYATGIYLGVSGAGKSIELFESYGDPDSNDSYVFKR
ncbi:MAG: hypothetical protein WDM88_04595 [Galbitalea sp.]